MIKTQDAIRVARSLIGTPYSEMDCIALIRAVIRQSPGGVKDYRCEGTNWLWDSVKNSGKYRHLTERHEGLEGIPEGALPFKRYGADGEDHVGIATGEGTVIHSSSVKGCVVETPLTAAEGWDCWGVHRYIETEDGAQAQEDTDMTDTVQFRAVVQTARGALNMREAASTAAAVVGRIPKGEIVDVYEKDMEFWLVGYGGKTGWCAEEYLSMVGDEVVEPTPERTHTSLISEDGVVIVIKGVWRVAED